MAKAVGLCDVELLIVHEFSFLLTFCKFKTYILTVAFTNFNYALLLFGAACSDVFNQQRVVRK